MVLRARPVVRICLILVGLSVIGWLYNVARRQTLDAALLDAVKAGHTSIAEILLRRGAHIEARSKDMLRHKIVKLRFFAHDKAVLSEINSKAWWKSDFTALALAVDRNDKQTVKMLLNHGANPNAKTPADGTSPPYDIIISTAAEKGDVEMMEMLLNAGGQVDARTGMGVTPLMLAAGHDHIAAVQLLIRRGADVNAKDERGFCAMSFAKDMRLQNHDAVIRILRGAGAKP